MKRTDNKSHCPVNYALEVVGDRWSLLILRDIVYFGKRTYNEFLGSSERITTNVLASRLNDLTKHGVIVKVPRRDDRRKEDYSLTEKGLALIPVLFELEAWGASYDVDTVARGDWLQQVVSRRTVVLKVTRETVRRGGCIFYGDDSVLRKLASA